MLFLDSKAAIARYAALWIFLLLLIGVMLRATVSLSWLELFSLLLPAGVIWALLCLSASYVCRSAPLGVSPYWKVFATALIGGMCVSAAMGLTIRVMVKGFLEIYYPDLNRKLMPASPILAGTSFLVFGLNVAIGYCAAAVKSTAKAQSESRDAEFRALKAQVNPHFLFNSLNSITALTGVDPLRARHMSIVLSDFLRTSLRLGERRSIPLGEELALTRRYLEVEQVRFGERLQVSENVEPQCAACDVPPLLVQPLVENAVKHGIANLAEGGTIALGAQRSGNLLCVTVENPFDPDAPPGQSTGFGLNSVRGRIRALCGAAGKLDIKIEGGLYRVSLWLPWADRKG